MLPVQHLLFRYQTVLFTLMCETKDASQSTLVFSVYKAEFFVTLISMSLIQ